jgi:hypothetical protein
MKTFLAHRDAGRPWLRPMPGPFPWLLARVGGLGPNEDNPLAGTWQVAFLGETEPRAARPGNTAPASEASRPTPAAAVNKTHQRTPLSQRGAKLSTFDTLVFRSDSTLRGRHLNTQHVACRVYRTLPPIPRRQAAFRTPRCWHRFAPALTWVRLVVLEMGEGGAEWTSGPSRTFVRG